MTFKKTTCVLTSLCLAAASYTFAEENIELDVPALSEEIGSVVEVSAPTGATQEQLTEMLGYLTAMGGGIGSLQLDEAAASSLADGLHKFLNGQLDIMQLPEAQLQSAMGEAQARVEASQSGIELPAFSEGSLELLGAIVGIQSGLVQLGFGPAEADTIRKGFVAGALAKEMSAEYEAIMPFFQTFIQGRMEAAQASMMAEEQAAQEAAMAQFQEVANEWSEKENMSVILETTQGNVEIELYPHQAPLAVANFVGHVENGYYDGLIFHRVIDGFMIQGGDPLGTGTGGESIWGKPFPDEFTEELRFDQEGLLAMANSGPMTNGSQFFITTSKPNWLNDRHTIFGKVVSGYDNVVKIEKSETGAQDKPVETQEIIKAYVKK